MRRQDVDDDELEDGPIHWGSPIVPDGGRVRVPMVLMDSAGPATLYQKGYRFVDSESVTGEYRKARAIADQSRDDYIRQITSGRQANSPDGPRLSDDDVDRVARRLGELFKLAPPVPSLMPSADASGLKQRPTDGTSLQRIRDASYQAYLDNLQSQHPSNRRLRS
jgi:hypothetical protein